MEAIQFESTHKLDFMTAPWNNPLADPGMAMFKVGTCDGLYQATNESYCIIAIVNDEPGNGHLDDVFEWFENSCKRDSKSLIIMEVMNQRFKAHLINKRGFVMMDEENLIKTF